MIGQQAKGTSGTFASVVSRSAAYEAIGTFGRHVAVTLTFEAEHAIQRIMISPAAFGATIRIRHSTAHSILTERHLHTLPSALGS